MARNPEAHDTLEGVAGWWLLEHRIRTHTALVRDALEELAGLGLVEESVSGQRTRYRIDPRYRGRLEEIEEDLNEEP